MEKFGFDQYCPHLADIAGIGSAPLIDTRNKNYCGMVNMDEIRWLLFDTGLYDVVTMEQIMDKSGKVAQIDGNLKTVLQMMEEKQSFSIPVLSEKRFVGMVSKATLLDFYRTELKTQTCS